MFGSAYALLSGSTFALRMRDDLPIQGIVVVFGGILSFLPLLYGRRYLGALLVSSFVISGIGAYWWTTIPWDEFIKDSGFPTAQKPTLWDHALVASPTMVAAFYAVVSRPSILHADLRERGADIAEVRRASAASFLSGAALLVFCIALAGGLWAIMASGSVFAAVAPIPTGIPALVIVAALGSIAWAIFVRRIPAPWRQHGMDSAASSAERAGAVKRLTARPRRDA